MNANDILTKLDSEKPGWCDWKPEWGVPPFSPEEYRESVRESALIHAEAWIDSFVHVGWDESDFETDPAGLTELVEISNGEALEWFLMGTGESINEFFDRLEAELRDTAVD